MNSAPDWDVLKRVLEQDVRALTIKELEKLTRISRSVLLLLLTQMCGRGLITRLNDYTFIWSALDSRG